MIVLLGSKWKEIKMRSIPVHICPKSAYGKFGCRSYLAIVYSQPLFFYYKPSPRAAVEEIVEVPSTAKSTITQICKVLLKLNFPLNRILIRFFERQYIANVTESFRE